MLPEYTTLSLNLENHIAHLQLNRPERANAMNRPLWRELGEAMQWADATPEVRVVVLGGTGKNFCAGIDLAMLGELMDDSAGCGARKNETLRQEILWLQGRITAIEQCRKPVLAAIHGACVGGGVDLVSACDIRYCTADAVFSIKEIDIGMVADVGTMQRLPRLIGDGMMRELAYTGRDVSGGEAAEIGLANKCFADQDTMMEHVFAVAATIAAKSPLSIRGSKQIILHSRDHSVADGLEQIATWNAGMLMSDDVKIALEARQKRQVPIFPN